jgi:serine protease inhibitor
MMIKSENPVNLYDSISSRRSLLVTLIIACIVALVSVILFPPSGRSASAVSLPQDPFEKYIDSNGRFGTKLFRDLLAENPDKNLIFSPLGISSLFAGLREGTGGRIRNELDKAFEWAPDQDLGPPHKRLVARFIFPLSPSPEEERRREAQKRLEEDLFTDDEKIRRLYEAHYLPSAASGREELWLQNSLQFHGSAVQNAFSERFLEKAKNDFSLVFDKVSDAKEWDTALSRFPVARSMLDSGTSERNIFILTSVVYLNTKWKWGQFGLNAPTSGEFLTVKGSRVPVTMLTSHHDIFPYAKTGSYEAVVLPAENADFVVIMPNEGVSLKTLAEAFTEDPDFFMPRLERRSGDIEMPEVNFVRKEDFKSRLENLGVKTVFTDLGDLVKIPGSRLLTVEQTVSFLVDEIGIQAKAMTSIVGYLGGRLENDEGFHMKINRPFLFQIRDNKTGALLFMGAVMDPSRH